MLKEKNKLKSDLLIS
jgi:large subunit ribosomal protein L47